MVVVVVVDTDDDVDDDDHHRRDDPHHSQDGAQPTHLNARARAVFSSSPAAAPTPAAMAAGIVENDN
jgi:hypothetical protein